VAEFVAATAARRVRHAGEDEEDKAAEIKNMDGFFHYRGDALVEVMGGRRQA